MVIKSSASPKSKVKITKIGGGDKMSDVMQGKKTPKGALRKEKIRNVTGKTNSKPGKGKLKTSGPVLKKLKSASPVKPREIKSIKNVSGKTNTKLGKGKLKTSGTVLKKLKSVSPVKLTKMKSTNEPKNASRKDTVGKVESVKNDKVGKDNLETIGAVQAKRKSTDEFHSLSKKQKIVNVKGKDIVKADKKNATNSIMFFRKIQEKMEESGDTMKGKPVWKEIKKLTLEWKEERKKGEMTSANYETFVKAKKLWEEVRQKTCTVEKRAMVIASLFKIVEDKLTVFVFKHDVSRIVQWLLKEGTPLIRLSITRILRPEIKEMLLQKFSRCCVKNMLKYGDEECRRIVFSEINGHVMKLMTSVVSAPIVEYGYASWATPEEKLSFQCEFYGNMLKLVSDAKVFSLKDALSLKEVGKDVLVDTKANILRVVFKYAPVSQLMHSIILEFLKLCEEADRNDIIDILYLKYEELVQTKEGAEVAMICCWFTSGRVRKIILKSLKGNVKEVCLLPYGHWFLMALLDSVDDTVHLAKTVLSELLTNVIELLSHENGRKVIMYLVAHRNPAFFHPELISLLKTADSSTFVKKDMDTKRHEILKIIMKPLANVISNDVTPWFENSTSAMVLMAVLNAGKEDIMMDAYRAVASYICQDIQVPFQNKNIAFVEHSGFHFVIKKILKNETGESHATLSYQLADHLTKEVIWKWMDSNRGCFLLLFILESKNKIASQVLMEKFTAEMKKHIAKGGSIGADALSRKLSDSDNN